jgi:hypothetical protein
MLRNFTLLSFDGACLSVTVLILTDTLHGEYTCVCARMSSATRYAVTGERNVSDTICLQTKHILYTQCIFLSVVLWRRSQRPRLLRRRSAAECLLGSWVRIPPGAWMFVCCECLCCQVEVSATGRSLVQRSPTDCGVCLSVIK